MSSVSRFVRVTLAFVAALLVFGTLHFAFAWVIATTGTLMFGGFVTDFARLGRNVDAAATLLAVVLAFPFARRAYRTVRGSGSAAPPSTAPTIPSP